MPKTCVVWFSTQIITCHIIATSPHLWRIWATNTSTTFRNSKNKLQQSNVLSKLARYSEPPSSKRKKKPAQCLVSHLLSALRVSTLCPKQRALNIAEFHKQQPKREELQGAEGSLPSQLHTASTTEIIRFL